MDLLEVYLMTIQHDELVSRHMSQARDKHPDNSSIDSCGGKGSSSPRPIISQVKLFCIGIELKSNVSGADWGGCGELSPLNCQRSGSTRLMGGSGTVRFVMGGVLLILGSAGTATAGASLVTVLATAGGSWVLSSVSTCSGFPYGQQGRSHGLKAQTTACSL